nr:MAG TPA: tail protein [Bacteriophage sp.]
MITVTDRKYNKICQLHFGSIGELIAYDDLFEQDLDTGIGIYEFKVDKTHDSIVNIVAGCYLFVPDDEITRCFEITRIEEDHDTKIIIAEDAGLDLLGETVPPFKSEQTQKLDYYVSKFTFDSGWEIGVNEVADITRKLEFEQYDTTTKRLRALAKVFDAELVYSVEMLHDKPHRKLINFYKKYNADKIIRLEYGTNVTKIKKTTNIENLATAIRSVGAEGITLADYQYNDSRYILSSDGVLYDPIENERWRRNNASSGGYIVANYESEAKTKERLLEETIKQLKKRAYPEVTYEVDLDLIGAKILIGQMAEISDSEFNPAIAISARVTSVKRSFSKKNIGSVKISNVTSTEVLFNEKLQRLSKLVQERVFDSTAVPFVLDITSSSGTVFQNGNIQTKLISSVSKLGTVMTNRFQFRWTRKSKFASDDTEWNQIHSNSSNELQITVSDVDREATFICEAIEGNQVVASNSIVIKDFIVNKSISPTPPSNPSVGDLWTDTSVPGKDVPKIFTNGEWKPVLNKDDKELERLQKEFEERNREHANQFAQVMEIINKNEVNNDTLRDLTGKFSNMEDTYNRIMATADEIKGLGQRTKAVELNLEQSQLLINTLASNFSLSEDGFLLGKNGSKLQIKMTNERMEFIDSGRVVAFVSGQTMNIVSATFWNSVTIANHIFERFNDEFTTISYVGGALIGKNI